MSLIHANFQVQDSNLRSPPYEGDGMTTSLTWNPRNIVADHVAFVAMPHHEATPTATGRLKRNLKFNDRQFFDDHLISVD